MTGTIKNKIIILDNAFWIKHLKSYLLGTNYHPYTGESIESLGQLLQQPKKEEILCVLLAYQIIAYPSEDIQVVRKNFMQIRNMVDSQIPILVMFDFQNQIQIEHLQNISTLGLSECWVRPLNKDKMMELIEIVHKNYVGKQSIYKIPPNIKILIVEDDSKWAEYLSEPLKREELPVITMKTFAEAKKELDKNEFSLVISDLSLDSDDIGDDSGGIKLLTYIRKKEKEMNREKTPIIVVSHSHGNDQVANLFRIFDISDFYNKSHFSGNKLRKSVFSLLSMHNI